VTFDRIANGHWRRGQRLADLLGTVTVKVRIVEHSCAHSKCVD
jgi:hypothetical protein